MSDFSALVQQELGGGNGQSQSFTPSNLADLTGEAQNVGLDPGSASATSGANAVLNNGPSWQDQTTGSPGGNLVAIVGSPSTQPAPDPNGSSIQTPLQTTSATTATQPSQASYPTTANTAAASFVPGQTVTDQSIANVLGNQVANPKLAAGTSIDPTTVKSDASDIQQNEQLGADPTATFNNQTAATTAMQPSQAAAQMTPTANATQQVAANQAIAAQGSVDPRATVQGQYNSLTAGVDAGNIPDWAKGAATAANQQMAARGLGASTMAGNATASAILQAALPIAQQDAATYASMESQNLTNAQQTVIANQQAMVNAIFSDQSVMNAAAQFNATSTNQVDQFYKSLATNTSQFNAAQTNSMSQFNASGDQAISQFNAQLSDLRQRFNVQNAIAIDQSNVTWNRQINTANTAAVNAAQQTNATNLLGISNTATANLWQQALDDASHAFTASQNTATLNANIAMAALVNNQNVSNALMTGVGNFASNLLGNALKTLGS